MALFLGNALALFSFRMNIPYNCPIALHLVDGWILSSGEPFRMWEVCVLLRCPGKSNVAEKLRKPLGAEMKSFDKTWAWAILVLVWSSLGSQVALEQLEYRKLHVWLAGVFPTLPLAVPSAADALFQGIRRTDFSKLKTMPLFLSIVSG